MILRYPTLEKKIAELMKGARPPKPFELHRITKPVKDSKITDLIKSRNGQLEFINKV